MDLVTRAAWDARPSRGRTALIKAEQLGTAVHYTGMDADETADHDRCADRVQSIQNFHLDGRGWSDIAYSYLACKHGFIFEGRGVGVRTAAQGTNHGNDAFHAVCFLGDDSAGRDDVTDPGRAAIRQAVAHCNAWSGATQVRPHSSFHATGCPGEDLRAWIAAGMPIADLSEEDDDMTPAQETLLRETRDAARQLHTDMSTLLGSDTHASTKKLLAEQLETNRLLQLLVDGLAPTDGGTP